MKSTVAKHIPAHIRVIGDWLGNPAAPAPVKSIRYLHGFVNLAQLLESEARKLERGDGDLDSLRAVLRTIDKTESKTQDVGEPNK